MHPARGTHLAQGVDALPQLAHELAAESIARLGAVEGQHANPLILPTQGLHPHLRVHSRKHNGLLAHDVCVWNSMSLINELAAEIRGRDPFPPFCSGWGGGK
jgi:hypothetical protein